MILTHPSHLFCWHTCQNYQCIFVHFQTLETLLPPREKIEIPTGEDVEEVSLSDYDPRGGSSGGRRMEMYDDDDGEDDENGAGPRVQCAHQ